MKRIEREAHKQAWQESGKSKKAYCESEGIKYLTFISWFKEKIPGGTFQKIKVKERVEEIELLFPNGIRLYSRQKINLEFLKIIQSA